MVMSDDWEDEGLSAVVDADGDFDELTAAIATDGAPEEHREIRSRIALPMSPQESEEAISRIVTAVPDHPSLRALADHAKRLHIFLGDKEGMAAQLSTEILSELFLLSEELRSSPMPLILAAIDRLPPENQIAKLDQAIGQLERRRAILTLREEEKGDG